MPHFSQKEERLLERAEFSRLVLERSGGKCVACGSEAQDPHHLLDRSLFDDGGYYLSNGVGLCAACRLDAESTVLDARDLRAKAGITNSVLPDHLEVGVRYDKWGDPFVGAMRLKGEMFFEPQIQKLLEGAGLLGDFLNKVKYPRTMHLLDSPNLANDDRRIATLRYLEEAKEVVVTEKMDGECTTMMRDSFYARALDSRHHTSRDWAKALWGSMHNDIPDGWRICGENVYARHSITYTGLPSYFLGFGIWTERNERLSWDDCTEWFNLLGVTMVPVLYRGKFDSGLAGRICAEHDYDGFEGVVISVTDSYKMREHKTHCAKWVRKGHVQTDTHWMEGPVVPNLLG